MAKRFIPSPDIAVLQAKLGATIKLWRGRLGITQEELAWRSDMHRTYIADIERGRRNVTLRSIAQLAAALKVSVEALLAQAESSETALAPDGGPGGRPGLQEIFLVEDDPADVDWVLRAFKRAKFSNPVRVFGDGESALDHLARTGREAGFKPPRVILLDLQLPKLTGLEVLRRLKAQPETSAIPVVVLTGSHEDKNIVECARLGAENYIIKPVTFESFFKVASRFPLEWALVNGAAAGAPAKREADAAAPGAAV